MCSPRFRIFHQYHDGEFAVEKEKTGIISFLARLVVTV